MYLRIILIFIFSHQIAYSQQRKSIVLDSFNNKVLPFSTIKILGKQTGVYGLDDGSFSLPLSINATDSLEVSHVGYKTLKLTYKTLKDTVFLIPKINELEEIIISNKNWKSKTISTTKVKTTDWFLGFNEELATLVKPNIKCNNCILKTITIPIGKKTVREIKGTPKVTYPDFDAVLELNFYSVKENRPSLVSLLNKAIFINVNQDSSETIVLNLSEEYISLDKNGIYISIEILTSLEEINRNSFLPSFKITTSKNKKSTANSFYRNEFIDNEWLLISERTNFFIKEDSNLVLGIEVLVNEN